MQGKPGEAILKVAPRKLYTVPKEMFDVTCQNVTNGLDKVPAKLFAWWGPSGPRSSRDRPKGTSQSGAKNLRNQNIPAGGLPDGPTGAKRRGPGAGTVA